MSLPSHLRHSLQIRSQIKGTLKLLVTPDKGPNDVYNSITSSSLTARTITAEAFIDFNNDSSLTAAEIEVKDIRINNGGTLTINQSAQGSYFNAGNIKVNGTLNLNITDVGSQFFAESITGVGDNAKVVIDSNGGTALFREYSSGTLEKKVLLKDISLKATDFLEVSHHLTFENVQLTASRISFAGTVFKGNNTISISDYVQAEWDPVTVEADSELKVTNSAGEKATFTAGSGLNLHGTFIGNLAGDLNLTGDFAGSFDGKLDGDLTIDFANGGGKFDGISITNNSYYM